MKTKVVPISFSEMNECEKYEFDEQIEGIRSIYYQEIELSEVVELEQEVPGFAEVIIFPKLINAAFRHNDVIKKYKLPAVILTSKFGTVEMWDWEIVTYLRAQGRKVSISPIR